MGGFLISSPAAAHWACASITRTDCSTPRPISSVCKKRLSLLSPSAGTMKARRQGRSPGRSLNLRFAARISALFSDAATPPLLYVAVEKILGFDESIPEDWRTAGTSGYDALNRLSGLFVDQATRPSFRRDIKAGFVTARHTARSPGVASCSSSTARLPASCTCSPTSLIASRCAAGGRETSHSVGYARHCGK